ncbi:peptidylprolyl isomerase [Dellaglioa sp. P0083]|uniref:peptidylprolyl isomerase n=1 Tax=Dellaglioa kimchii TaxID=3344667 RepID=UPI0038D3F380
MKNKKMIGLIAVIIIIILGGIGFFFYHQNAETTNDTETTTSSSSIASNVELPQLSSKVTKKEAVVDIQTTKGNIKIKLFPEYAPKAVKNFITHSKKGYYNNTLFHRVINEFMIQGGDPKGDGTGGESIYGHTFGAEISSNLYHIRGALAMAQTSEPDSIGSQFYIVQNNQDVSTSADIKDGTPSKIIDAYKNGGTPSLDGTYTVFGQVIKGMDVVDKIAAVAVNSSDKPTTNVKVKTIKVLQEAK